jgi:hypothetical protein
VFDPDGDEPNDAAAAVAAATSNEDNLAERGKLIARAIAPDVASTRRGSHPSPFRRPSTSHQHTTESPQQRRPSLQYGASGQPTEMVSPPRRFSNAVPAIFAHSGVRTPPAVVEAQRLLSTSDLTTQQQQQQDSVDAMPTVEEKQPSIMSQLPLPIIFQYGWLALHSTTHDMIFLTYVVS